MNTSLRLNDFDVPGYNLKVNGNLEIKTEEVSGETSGSGQIEKGIKPKTLTVTLSIRFDDYADLKSIVQAAEYRNDDGELTIYTITNLTANAASVRQVQFCDNLRWTEQDGLSAWNVSFTLREYLSVPERAEQRQKTASTTSQDSDTTTVAGTSTTETESEAEPETLIEKLLAKVEAVLA